MQIETKFNFNQTVYFMRESKIVRGSIEAIHVKVERSGIYQSHVTDVKYHVSATGGTFVLADDAIYSTPQECANSLLESMEE